MRLPTLDFQVLLLLVSGRVILPTSWWYWLVSTISTHLKHTCTSQIGSFPQYSEVNLWTVYWNLLISYLLQPIIYYIHPYFHPTLHVYTNLPQHLGCGFPIHAMGSTTFSDHFFRPKALTHWSLQPTGPVQRMALISPRDTKQTGNLQEQNTQKKPFKRPRWATLYVLETFQV